MFDENTPRRDQDDRSAKAGGYRVEDNGGTEERNLRRNPLFGQGKMQNVHEGQPMGGHHFDKDTPVPPFGDDKDNPSRYAGYSNAYFARTQPMDENTANNNFKAPHQEGQPDYEKAQHVPDSQEQQKTDKSNTNTTGKTENTADFSHQADYGRQNIGGEQEHIET